MERTGSASGSAEKLMALKARINITEEELDALRGYSEVFAARKVSFAEQIHEVFSRIPEAKVVLESEREPGLLKKVWAEWFRWFFSAGADGQFLERLWGIGVRHVQVNLDQRFSNLAFAVTRQFCHGIILSDIPAESKVGVMVAVDKLLDLAVLVETSAYIETATHCDIELIREMADRIRNPSVVIGGQVRRLQKKVTLESNEYKVYQTLIGENERLERLVRDIKTYMDVFNHESRPERSELAHLIDDALSRLRKEKDLTGVLFELAIDRASPPVKGDGAELGHLFYYLLENSIEAVDPDHPLVRISSVPRIDGLQTVQVDIFNTGMSPGEVDPERLLAPFYSTKETGTGFGLPIARLVAKKNVGRLEIRAEQGVGTHVLVTLSAVPPEE